MKSFLVSWLAKQFRGLDLERFERARPEHWLVWEAGPWRPPTPGETLQAADKIAFAAGESLAIVLAPRAGGGGGEVRLGRAADNDLVVDDATLSRSHLAFARTWDGGWQVRDLASSNGTRVGGRRLGAEPVALATGILIEAGSVRLTYYDPPGMHLRLRAVGAARRPT